MKNRRFTVLGLVAALVLVVVIVAAACTAPRSTATPPGGSAITSGGAEQALLSAALKAYQATSGQQAGIWVSGEGRVTVVPDIAVLSLGVETKASTVAEAQRQASAAMNAVISALRSHNVADKDIRTQSFNISPVYKYVDRSEPILDGYRVSNMVVVKIRSIGDAGAIIDDVAGAGGDLTRVNSIYFAVDNPKPLQDQAREDAVRDAIAKAQQMARVAGVTLGKPVSITESGGYQPPPLRVSLEAKDVAAAATPISPGETEITVNVQIVFGID